MRKLCKRIILLLSVITLFVCLAGCNEPFETTLATTSDSFSSSARVTGTLTLQEVERLSAKGSDLTWSDFDDYNYVETGSGLYIRVYEMDQGYSLMIGGGSSTGNPMYIKLTAPDGRDIDIRTSNVKDFINGKSPDPSEMSGPTSETASSTSETTSAPSAAVDENGSYTHKDDVALYIHTYGRLPSNFITKKKAKELGWSSGGLDEYINGGCIGGDRFGNYEGNLPESDGRKYYECDIDTMHSRSRGSKRIVYSNDGLIYYTEDHYSTFELLYGAEV